jgi:hypothetical protein
MNLDSILTVALDVAFFAVFGLTLVDHVRHRARVRLAIMLVFATVAAMQAWLSRPGAPA